MAHLWKAYCCTWKCIHLQALKSLDIRSSHTLCCCLSPSSGAPMLMMHAHSPCCLVRLLSLTDWATVMRNQYIVHAPVFLSGPDYRPIHKRYKQLFSSGIVCACSNMKNNRRVINAHDSPSGDHLSYHGSFGGSYRSVTSIKLFWAAREG